MAADPELAGCRVRRADGRLPTRCPRTAALARRQLSGRLPAAELGLHLRQLAVDLARARQRLQLAVDVVVAGTERGQVLEGPRRLELLDGTRSRLHVLGLVERPLHREPNVGHLLADAGRGLGDPDLRLGRRVLGLDDLLARAELLDLGAQLLLGLGQLLLLLLELGDLLVERLQLGLRDVLTLERRPGEVLLTSGNRLTGLRVELDDLLAQGLLLELQTFLRGDDVRDPLLDVLQLLDLLLVAVLERLGWILGPIEQLRNLGFYDCRHATGKSRHRILLGGGQGCH